MQIDLFYEGIDMTDTEHHSSSERRSTLYYQVFRNSFYIVYSSC